ncbi:hypothetical protein FRC12_010161, partial [Ceratobasidium sp. 428]
LCPGIPRIAENVDGIRGTKLKGRQLILLLPPLTSSHFHAHLPLRTSISHANMGVRRINIVPGNKILDISINTAQPCPVLRIFEYLVDYSQTYSLFHLLLAIVELFLPQGAPQAESPVVRGRQSTTAPGRPPSSPLEFHSLPPHPRRSYVVAAILVTIMV